MQHICTSVASESLHSCGKNMSEFANYCLGLPGLSCWH